MSPSQSALRSSSWLLRPPPPCPPSSSRRFSRCWSSPLKPSPCSSPGPKIIDTNGPIRIPRISAGLTVGFVAEGGTIPETSVGMDEVTMLPSTLKSLKVLSRVTSEALRSSAVALDSILKQRLTTDTAAALDNALFTGTGATNTIKGLLAQTGVATGVLGRRRRRHPPDGIGVARANEVKPNRWFLSPADYLAIRKIKDLEGRYVLQPDITADGREQLFGVPVTVTSRIPTGRPSWPT